VTDDAEAELLASLCFRDGEVEIGFGLATARLDRAYRFLGPEDASRVLVDAWGNLPGTSALGMIFPAGSGPLDEQNWAVAVQYEDDGYVADDGTATLDDDRLLRGMKADTREANAERARAGYAAAELIGWAEPPSYEPATHQLYWAKELALEGSDATVLNYNVRILGRRGVLVLNAVGGVHQLAEIRGGMRDLLTRVEFTQGNRYTDFDPSVDAVAVYGIGALVAGKLAPEVGPLAKPAALLLAAKDRALGLGAVLSAYLRKLFGIDKRDSSVG